MAQVQSSSVSLSDILTAAKNIVTAINGWTTATQQLNGTQNFSDITSDTVISSAPGRIVQVCVVAAGSTTGTIYDAVSTDDTSRPLYTISNTVGVVNVNLPVAFGIMISPGSGQTISGGFS